VRARALSIAGIDPTAGAGLLLDEAVFLAWGLAPCGVATAMTAQNSSTFGGYEAVSSSLVADAIEAVLADGPVACVKVGMLASPANAKVVSAGLPEGVPIVLDPVAMSTTGGRLAVKSAFRDIVDEVARVATLVTPNAAEAQALAGSRISSVAEAKGCVEALAERWDCAVVITGVAHKSGAVDVLVTSSGVDAMPHEILEGVGDPRGTGCLFSTACTAALRDGKDMCSAVESAQQFVLMALREASQLGIGRMQVDLVRLLGEYQSSGTT